MSSSSSSSPLSPNSFQFNRHEELLSKTDTNLLLPPFFTKSPLSFHEDRSIMAGENIDFGDGFCSPVEEPLSPTSYLVRPQEIQEVEDDGDHDFQPDSSSDDLFSSEEAESSSSNHRLRSAATTSNKPKKKKQTLAELMNFDASRQSREESLSLLRKSRQRLLEKSKSQQQQQQRHLHGKESLLILAVCGGKKPTLDHLIPSSSSNSSSRRRSCNEPSPLKSSIPRSKSSALRTSSSSNYEVNLTKSKSVGAASYVVRVDQTGGSSSGAPRVNQQRSSSSGRKSSVSFAASSSVVATSDSMVTVMDRYQQRIKEEHSRKHGSSYLPYKRALLSLFFPLPSLWSSHHHHRHRNHQQQQQQYHHHQQQHHHQTVAYS
ncbi:hypothetical protein SELMODRAFT_442695 [Selaginella moellendorffii]|uniref:Uncharacterized protein n=1 Tax=Selaginella moellendorffii TaxID=88036 RepID=D8RVD5_SELML|nr:hypothetical protein SELMODRAFT_442695 [Selaginella moellendorffii]